MKKLLSFMLVLTMLFALAIPAMAAPAKDNANQDFTGTPVTVNAPDEVLVNEDAQVIVTVTNVADRGLPDVTIWVNSVCVKSYSEIGKGKSVEIVIDVDTAEAGVQAFDVVVWTRLGNKNFQDKLYEGTTTIAVVEPVPEEKTVEQWLEDLNDALNKAISDGTFEIVNTNNKTYVTLTVDGVDYTFEGGNGVRSDKVCYIDGVAYVIRITGNPAAYQVVRG